MPQSIGFVGSSLTFNNYLNKYIAVGTGSVYNVQDKNWRTGFLFSLSDDLIHWSPQQLIMEATLNPAGPWSGEWLGYPSLIDPTDTSRNFEVTEQEPYLYFTRAHPPTKDNKWGLDRDLVRIPIRFSQETIPTAWEFDQSGNDEGWLPWNQLTPFTISEGVLQTSSIGNDPYMLFDPILNLDASIYKTIEIRMKVGHGNNAKLYFTTVEDETWDESKSIQFDLKPGDNYMTYKLDMEFIKTWAGRISKIRLDPTEANSDIEIDYIRIYTIEYGQQNTS